MFDKFNSSFEPFPLYDNNSSEHARSLEFADDFVPTHYRNATEGQITLYGNSCIIKEKPFNLYAENEAPRVGMKPTIRKRLSARQLKLIENDPSRYNELIEKYQASENEPPIRKANDISGFSKKSRLNMLKKLNRIDFKGLIKPFFITLTYPGRYPTDRKRYKRDLDVFLKRLKRAFGTVNYLWRLEAQKRGAPHYHFIIYFDKTPVLKELKQWVSLNWYEVVQFDWETKDEKHLRVGTNCKVVKHIKMAMHYVSKYMSKEQEDMLIDQGRYWGTSRGWGVLVIKDYTLSAKQLIAFRRTLKRYLKQNVSLAKRVVQMPNIEVWAYYSFIMDILKWVVLNYD